MLMATMTCVSPLRLLAVTLAAGQVVSEGLGFVDRLLLALRVVRVDYGRCRVAGRLAAAEALASHFEVFVDARPRVEWFAVRDCALAPPCRALLASCVGAQCQDRKQKERPNPRRCACDRSGHRV